MLRSEYFTTENLLDTMHHQNYYKSMDIVLSRQANTTKPQKINFVGKLEEDKGAIMFFITEKQQRTYQNLSLDSLNMAE